MDIYVGRQPIFDRQGNIYGFELLHRNSDQNSFPDVNPEQATLSVLINTFVSIGFDRVSDGNLSFINFTEKLLLNKTLQLHPRQVVIEVLEDVVFTPQIIARLREFKKEGFKIALDDFVLTKTAEQYPELFKLITFIKVDFLNTTEAERHAVENLVNTYPNIILLAEKIETQEEYEIAKSLGYGLFQGYFFARPEIIKSKDVPANYAMHLHVINLLNSEAPNINEIADFISRDVSLSYKMLRYINSLAFGIPNKITSIKQALVLMGIEEGRKWMQILLIHDMGQGEGQGQTRALVEYSLIRAKFCELLAKHQRKQNADEYFLMALFSMIDKIMKRKLTDILPLLPLSLEIKETLLGKATSMLPYLNLAIALEDLDLDKISYYAELIGVKESDISDFSREAYQWVTEF